MKCPFCRQTNTEVYNTRATKSHGQLWRRRRCLDCQQTFTTYESPDLKFLHVTSPDTPKPLGYSRARLFSSLFEAFHGLPDPSDTIDAVTDTVEAKILDLRQPTISTKNIAGIVLTTLKHFHTGAFLRYLSSHAELASTAEVRKALKRY